MDKLILLGGSDIGSRVVFTACPKCGRISRQILKKEYNSETNCELVEARMCPVCGTEYLYCSSEDNGPWLKLFQKNRDRVNDYNKAAKKKYLDRILTIGETIAEQSIKSNEKSIINNSEDKFISREVRDNSFTNNNRVYFEEEMSSNANEYEKVPLEGRLAEFRDALEQEIYAVEKNFENDAILTNGRELSPIGGLYRYIFDIEYTPAVLPDTPCLLKVGKTSFDVVVIAVDESSITITTETKLVLGDLGRVKLQTGSVNLLKQLIKRIEEKRDIQNSFEDDIFSAGLPGLHHRKIRSLTVLEGESLNDSQMEAVTKSLKNDITFIWGPPGTGKTFAIRSIVAAILKNGGTALIASHTNTAVDGALKKIDKFLKEDSRFNYIEEKWPLLRLGTPSEDLPDRVMEDTHIKNRGKELYEEEKEIKNNLDLVTEEIRNFQIQINRINWITNLNTDYAGLKQQLRTQEKKQTELKAELFEINRKLDEFDKDQVDAYKRDSHKQKSLRVDAELLSVEIEKERVALDQAKAELISISDDIKKTQLRIKLTEQERELLSLESQMSMYDGKVLERKEIEEGINQYNIKIEQAKEKIDEIQKRSGLRKLFSGAELNTLSAEVEKLSKRVADLQNTLSTVRLREKQLCNEIEQHKLLNMQISDLEAEGIKSLDGLLLRQNLLNEELLKKAERIKKKEETLFLRYKTIEKLQLQIEKKYTFGYSSYESLLKKKGEIEANIRLENVQNSQLIKKVDAAYEYVSENLQIVEEDEVEGTESRIDYLIRQAEMISVECSNVDPSQLKDDIEERKNSLAELNKQLQIVQEKIEQIKNIIIQETPVIGTTLTRTYLNDEIQKRKFDIVIIDEVSMATLPALWCATCVAENSIVLIGDFMQLPPVVISNDETAKKWLGTDIFEASGIVERIKEDSETHKCGNPPDNFVTLDEQYRMEEEIAEIPNLYYREYNNTILKSRSDEERDKKKAELYRWFLDLNIPFTNDNHPIHIINTESLKACATGVNKSRCNYFNASLDVELAFALLQQKIDSDEVIDLNSPLVLIVTPYRPQVNLLKNMINCEFEYRNYPKEMWGLIKPGTIHSFQGQESDIVIFDLVIDNPHWFGIKLFNPEMDEENKKMFNVATSRAKFELFIVANKKYCIQKGKKAELKRLFENMERWHVPEYSAKELFPKLKYIRSTAFHDDIDYFKNGICLTGAEFMGQFTNDLRSFKEKMYIFSAFLSMNQITRMLPYFDDAIGQGKIIKVFTKDPSEWGKSVYYSNQKCVRLLKEHGVGVIYRGNMHEKVILIDDDIVWHGSLNALSFSGGTSEIMQRMESNEVHSKFVEGLDIKNLTATLERTEDNPNGDIICPVCGENMVAKEGRDGKIYWICLNDGLTWNPREMFPYDGIFKCEDCKTPYEFYMKNEPRWRCPNHHRNYKKVQWKELKLPNMKAIIPKEDLPRLLEYFHKSWRDFEELECYKPADKANQIEWEV